VAGFDAGAEAAEIAAKALRDRVQPCPLRIVAAPRVVKCPLELVVGRRLGLGGVALRKCDAGASAT
jgi:hypothetical protein